MKGLKKHSHRDRENVIEEMISLIQRKFGDNLVALAAQASYARNEDSDYSDLELIAFVQEMPEGKKMGGMGRIRDGLLVELVWMTKETYLTRTLDVTEDWFIAGSDKLLPILNEEFVERLSEYRIENLQEKCLDQATHRWSEVQESTAKVLNAIGKNDALGISLLAFDMYLHMLVVLAFLNQTPYVTFSQFISQSKGFKVKPRSFEELTRIVIDGAYRDLSRLEKVVVFVFNEFEKMFEGFGVELYDDNVDPNKPAKKFV